MISKHGALNQVVLLEAGINVLAGQYHEWESFDVDPTLAALLHIEYAGGPDITPPLRSTGQPSGTLPVGTTAVTLSLATDEGAVCKYSTNPVVAYGLMPNTFTATGGVFHSQAISGLTGGSAHAYYVKCQDAEGSANTDDFVISFSVAAPDTTPELP